MMKTKRIKTVPELIAKEFVAVLLACSILVFVSTVIDAPMGGPANIDGIPMESVKAPWIFVGIQQMLRILPPDLGGIIIPLLAITLLTLGPIVIIRNSFRSIIFYGVLVSGTILTVWGYLS
ncbi:MAG: hypothetical protein M1511_02650 [Deltaproteobacteria bacterium]|nr:hypothetical protein [Deltaproteobacteria bacterium]